MLGRRHRRTLWAIALAISLLAALFYWLKGPGFSTPAQLTDQIRQAVAAGKWARAERLLEQLARQHAPGAQVEILRAELDVARELPDSAIARLRNISENEPLAPHAWTMAGQIEKKRNRARPAEALFLEAVRLEPKLALARRELIFIYGMQARRADLNAQYQALAELAPLEYDDAFLWTTSLEDIWVNDTIRPTLEGFLAADPDDRHSRLALAQVLVRSNELDQADSVLLPLPDTDLEARVIRARLALARRNPDEARRLIAEGKEENVHLALLRGQVALQISDSKAAEQQFRLALKMDPANREAIHGLVLVFSRQGQTETAKQFLQQEQAWRHLTDLLLKASTSDARHDKQLLEELGESCEVVGRNAEARNWYRLALALDPLNGSLQRSLYILREKSR